MTLKELAGAMLLFSATASTAADKVEVHGLVLGNEGARFAKGVATLDLQQQRGAMQIRHLGFHDNRPVFAVAVFNATAEPVNIGLESFSVTAAGERLRVFTTQELERQAKRKAWWTQFGLAMAGAVSSASAASATNTYRSSLITPYGRYYGTSTVPSLAGQLTAYQIQRDTAFTMAMVQQRLDQAIDTINNRVLQRTTVDPGNSYAGLLVLDKLKNAKPPLELRISTDWNSERYDFGFIVQKTGAPVPEQFRAMLAVNAKPKIMSDQLVNVGGTTPAEALSGQANRTAQALASKAPAQKSGAIVLRSGLIKVPAKTPSGFCAIPPENYTASGSMNFPVINSNLPRCTADEVP